jgi:iron(III) transport system permease protein
MARPAIGAGIALALMETLADFGAVSVFNFDTFTTAIYKTWYGFFSLSSAAQLASLLLLVVMLVLYGERRARGASRAATNGRGQALYHLRGIKALLASGWCLLVFACAFVIPLLQLLVWFWQRGRHDLDERYVGLVLHTLYLGGMAALITVSVALLLAFARRQAPTSGIRAGVGLANLGYALPGSVLAVSIMLAFSYLDNELVIPLSSWLGGAGKPLLLGSLSALLLAYLVRFIAVAYGPLESSLARIRPSLPEAARSLGVSGPDCFSRCICRCWCRALERGAAGVRRRAQGNARDPADAPVRLGHPGGAGVRDDQRGRVGAGLVAGADPGIGGAAAGHRIDPPFGIDPVTALRCQSYTLRLQCAAFARRSDNKKS